MECKNVDNTLVDDRDPSNIYVYVDHGCSFFNRQVNETSRPKMVH